MSDPISNIQNVINSNITKNKAYMQQMTSALGDWISIQNTNLTPLGGFELIRNGMLEKRNGAKSSLKLADSIIDEFGIDPKDKGMARARLNEFINKVQSKYKLPAYVTESIVKNGIRSNRWWENITDKNTNFDNDKMITLMDDFIGNSANLYNKHKRDIDGILDETIGMYNNLKSAENSIKSANASYANLNSDLLKVGKTNYSGYDRDTHINAITDGLRTTNGLAQNTIDQINPLVVSIKNANNRYLNNPMFNQQDIDSLNPNTNSPRAYASRIAMEKDLINNENNPTIFPNTDAPVVNDNSVQKATQSIATGADSTEPTRASGFGLIEGNEQLRRTLGGYFN